MFKQQLISAVLGLCLVVAPIKVAVAADKETASGGVTTSQAPNESHKACMVPEKDGGAQGRAIDTPLTSQLWSAGYCYTYAGPVCPLVVSLPVGAPCSCYFPGGGSLAGVAGQ
jgi:hypothetical protein